MAKQVSKEALGGYRVHARGSGVVDNEADNEADAIGQVRRFLSYLPLNVWQMPPRDEGCDDPPDREDAALAAIVPEDPRQPYDMRRILSLVFDRASVFEIGRFQGRSQITALARLKGFAVGVLANDPCHFAGAMNYDSAEKFQRFVDMCDTFHPAPGQPGGPARFHDRSGQRGPRHREKGRSGPVSHWSRPRCPWRWFTSANVSVSGAPPKREAGG